MLYSVQFNAVELIIDAYDEDEARWKARELMEEIASVSSIDAITEY